MKLSVLEHGHINEGRSVQDTLQETVKLAQHADQLGYSRFWMSSITVVVRCHSPVLKL